MEIAAEISERIKEQTEDAKTKGGKKNARRAVEKRNQQREQRGLMDAQGLGEVLKNQFD
tara:strand:- start:1593 stop:1769 length:177 start_codon:yes stop_codon:yes gene_type:complete